jgi:hypothetical protein
MLYTNNLKEFWVEFLPSLIRSYNIVKIYDDLLCLAQCIHKPGLNHQVCLKQIQIMVDMICNGYIFGLAPCK